MLDDKSAPLYSIEAEHSVLGAMIARPELIDALTEDLTAEDFYRLEHKEIYRKIIRLHADELHIDTVTVSDNLVLPGHDYALAYIAEIVSNTPSAANAFTYAKIVTERAIRRRMLAAGAEIQELSRSTDDLQECVAKANDLITSIEAPCAGTDAVMVMDIMAEQLDEWEARSERHIAGIEFMGVSTGLSDADRVLSGLRPGQLIVIGGRPGNGKTTLAMNIAMHAAVEQKLSALVFSLEMSKGQLMDRLTAALAEVDLKTIINGSCMSDGESPGKMSAAAAKFRNSKLAIVDRGNLNINVVRSAARKFKHAHGLDLIVIDYLQLMTASGNNRNEEISVISRGAKLLARELNVPVLLLSQLNRDNTRTPGADSKPKISHLRDSGSIEQDADVVILVHRDPGNDQAPTELIIGKNRDGEQGVVPVAFLGKYNKFAPLEYAARKNFYDNLNKPAEPKKTHKSSAASHYNAK